MTDKRFGKEIENDQRVSSENDVPPEEIYRRFEPFLYMDEDGTDRRDKFEEMRQKEEEREKEIQKRLAPYKEALWL